MCTLNVCYHRLKGANYWIGLKFHEGAACRLDAVANADCWKWTDGTLVTWTNWDTNEPNDHHEELCGKTQYTDSGPKRWRNFACTNGMHFICEKHGMFDIL